MVHIVILRTESTFNGILKNEYFKQINSLDIKCIVSSGGEKGTVSQKHLKWLESIFQSHLDVIHTHKHTHTVTHT